MFAIKKTEATGSIYPDAEYLSDQLRDYTSSFISIIQEALPKMSKKYVEFYQHFLNDFQTNGLHMPIYGKIM